jgi:hypothetical protein
MPAGGRAGLKNIVRFPAEGDQGINVKPIAPITAAWHAKHENTPE